MTIAISGTPSGERRRDPRSVPPLPGRDYAALEYIGRWYQVAQYQLEDAIFPQRSPTVASRCVRRLFRVGFIAIERWNRIGSNLIRLTNRGRTVLVDRGVRVGSVFVPERPVSTKDLTHHLWIVDMGLVLARINATLEVSPCWALRRNLAAIQPAAIPDVLAIQLAASGAPAGVLAVEIDLGGERLKNVFVPKLRVLRQMLAAWSARQPAAIVVLTVGCRRVAALTAMLEKFSDDIPIVVRPLPTQTGRNGLAALQATFETALS